MTVILQLSSAVSEPDEEASFNKIPVYTKDGIRLVSPEDIICCKASGNCTMLYLRDRSKLVVTISIGSMAEYLDATVFFRTHKSWIVNLMEVDKLLVKSREIISYTGETLAVSRSKMPKLKQALGLN
ncbi:MAG: LytTR family transcriptional regulator [Cytophagales bacterium]|nr:LytTR family transcriptional regulator [Cytophagales bacterium]